MGDKPDLRFTLIIVGFKGGGKSSLVLRFSKDIFDPTINVSPEKDHMTVKTIELDGQTVKLCVMDQRRYDDSFTTGTGPMKFAEAVLIVYEITDQESFDDVKRWHRETIVFARKCVSVFIVGNKSDLDDERAIDWTTAKDYSDEVGATYMETSAKSGTNVDELFKAAAASLRDNLPVACEKGSKRNNSSSFCTIL